MQKATVFSDDPGKMAAQWAGRGARRLHVVDLNGARQGKPVNENAVKDIIASVDLGLSRCNWGAASATSTRSSVISTTACRS
jgi:phosphoribosylformimino-5-aminoimidazole carboxamide ribonucleotide (ProFAR) isomerase